MQSKILASFVLASLLFACITPTAYAQGLTQNEQAYAESVADHALRVSEAFDELSELMTNPQMGDDEWTISVATQLAIIQLLYDEAMEMEPPQSMAHIHYKYIQGMKHYETATHLIAQGFDELDINLIEQATAELYSGNELTNEATQLMEEFVETRLAESAPAPPSQPEPAAPSPTPPETAEDEGCFIATAAYGTDTANELVILREFRDEVLLRTGFGAEFVSFYYEVSPPIADFISKYEVLRTVVRGGLINPIVIILDWTHYFWAE